MVIWVIKIFFDSSVYSCHLFLISSASVMSISFLLFIVPIFPWNFSWLSTIFLKRSLASHSTVFLYFFSLITEGLSLLAILWNSASTWVYISFYPLPLSSHHLLSNTYNFLKCKQLYTSVIYFYHIIWLCSHSVYYYTHLSNIED